jgi:hypothetical protein
VRVWEVGSILFIEMIEADHAAYPMGRIKEIGTNQSVRPRSQNRPPYLKKLRPRPGAKSAKIFWSLPSTLADHSTGARWPYEQSIWCQTQPGIVCLACNKNRASRSIYLRLVKNKTRQNMLATDRSGFDWNGMGRRGKQLLLVHFLWRYFSDEVFFRLFLRKVFEDTDVFYTKNLY